MIRAAEEAFLAVLDRYTLAEWLVNVADGRPAEHRLQPAKPAVATGLQRPPAGLAARA